MNYFYKFDIWLNTIKKINKSNAVFNILNVYSKPIEYLFKFELLFKIE